MKPAAFEYFAPRSVAEVHACLAEHGDESRILAGGQSLVPLLNMRVMQLGALISINHCDSLDYIREEAGQIVIGARTRQTVALESSLIAGKCPLLAAVLPHVGPSASRNRGTVCGSLAHCDPLAELPVAAIALDARFVVSSASGRREVPAKEFFVSELTNCMEPEEMLEEVRFPVANSGLSCHFVEVGNRKHGFALAGIAVQYRLNENKCYADVRVAGLGFGGMPTRLSRCEQFLEGARTVEETFTEAARIASACVDPNRDIHASAAYRQRLAGVLLSRALREASSRDR